MERVKRRWWTTTVTIVAVMLVLGALITASFQLVMLVAPGYRQDLSDYVSRMAGQPIDIGGVGMGWTGLAPRLDLSNITLYGEEQPTPALSARKLSVGFGLLRLMRGDTTPSFIELTGVELFIHIDRSGRVSLRGIDTSGMPSRATQDWLRQLGRFDSVRLRDCEMKLEDERLQQEVPDFLLTSAEISFDEGEGRAVAELQLPPSMGQGVVLTASVKGDLKRPESWFGHWSADLLNLRNLPWIDAGLVEEGAIHFADTRLRLEGAIEGGSLGAMSIALDASRVEGSRRDMITSLDDITFNASVQPRPQGWNLEVTDLSLNGVNGPWPETRATIEFRRPKDGSPRLKAQTDYFLLADIAPWLPLIPGKAVREVIEKIEGLRGAVRGLSLDWRGAASEEGRSRYTLHAKFEDMGIDGPEGGAGFSGLSGIFAATEVGGSLALHGTPLQLLHPTLFDRPPLFESITGGIVWRTTERGLEVQAPGLELQLAGAEGKAKFELVVPGEKASPLLDLTVGFSAADATRLKPYMPKKWNPKLREWLDRAIVSARVADGQLRISGPVDQFPFKQGGGTYELDIDIADMDLRYLPDWPGARDVDARLAFRDNGLSVKTRSGSIAGNRIASAVGTIPDFGTRILDIEGTVEGDAGRFYQFLSESPLAPRLSGLLTRTQASGDATVNVQINVPLRDRDQVSVSGDVELAGARLDVRGLDEPIIDIRGALAFDRRSVSADSLHARMYDTPIQASLGRDAGGALKLSGRFTLASGDQDARLNALLPGFLRPVLTGQSDWQVALPLEGDGVGRLSLSSDLRGLSVGLPEPLNKTPESSWPTQLHFDSDPDFPLRLTVQIEDRLGATLAFARSGPDKLSLKRARIDAGSSAAPLAEDDGIVITGQARHVDPLRWAGLFDRNLSPTEPNFQTSEFDLPVFLDLEAGNVWLGAYGVRDVRLIFGPAPAGWQAELRGESSNGSIEYRDTANGGALKGEFGALHLIPQRSHEERDEDEERPDKAGSTPASPGDWPNLEFTVGRLAMGDADLGRLDLKTERIRGGQRISKLTTQGSGTSSDIRGQWLRVNERSSGDLQFSVQSSEIDELLEGFGYTPTIAAKRSRLRGSLQWLPGDASSASGLAWDQGSGSLEIDLIDGNLRTVKPGAGRVLGLINFYTLPRRLGLDFSDVVAEGLGFDEVEGSFSISDGVARTQNLDVAGPSLKMEVRGAVDLAERTYDQKITVYPDVSSGVTLGALLLGGPAAAVLALIAQEVLDQPLDQAGRFSYRLTGPWDDPRIVREGNEDATPSGAERTAEGAADQAPSPISSSP